MVFGRLQRALKGRRQPSAPARQSSATDVPATLALAVSHHQRGEIAEAEILYRRILDQQPDNFDALHLRGVVQHQTGRHQAAIESIRAAIAAKPREAAAYSNLGLALRAVGSLDEALASYDAALAIEPDHVEALLNRADVLQAQRRFEDALAGFKRATMLRPDDASAHFGCGNALVALQRHEEAVASYDCAVALDPARADAFNNRGNALLRLRRYGEALASFDDALALRPAFLEAHNNRGSALLYLKRPAEALASCERSLELEPDYAQALLNRGNALEALQRPVEALASLDRAVAIDPEFAQAWRNRANTLLAVGRPDDALASFRRASALSPDDPAIRYNEGLCRLLLGDFANGLPLYESRWQDEQLPRARREYGQPPWSGHEEIEGRTILLHAEQGLGDTIQFSRYAELVAARGARVVLEVPPALKRLLAALRGVHQVLAIGESLPSFDCHCPLLSLPLAFATRLETIPAMIPYVASDSRKVSEWRTRLGDSPRPRVGLAWSGSTVHTNDRNRSLPLSIMVGLVGPEAQFVSLQPDVRVSDEDVLHARGELLHFGRDLRDFTDTAALVELMDLVVTVDTAVAHLAGAMGKPVWILLPLNPDWRWLLDRDDSPWYRSARLFRQTTIGDWEGVIERVGIELRRRFRRDAGR